VPYLDRDKRNAWQRAYRARVRAQRLGLTVEKVEGERRAAMVAADLDRQARELRRLENAAYCRAARAAYHQRRQRSNTGE
jgi:hypothetical protein